MGRKSGAVASFWAGELDPHVHNVAWAEAYLRTKWHLNPSSFWPQHMGQNWEVLCPRLSGEA